MKVLCNLYSLYTSESRTPTEAVFLRVICIIAVIFCILQPEGNRGVMKSSEARLDSCFLASGRQCIHTHTHTHLQALAYALEIAGLVREARLFVSQTSGWMRIFWMIINDKPACSPWQPLYLLSLGPFHLNCKLWVAWVDGVSERDE